METQTTATTAVTAEKKVKSRLAPLDPKLKEQFIAYFMQRYPCTKRIKVGTNDKRAYAVRVNYRQDGVNRTFRTSAYTYETLVMKVCEWYTRRGVERARLA